VAPTSSRNPRVDAGGATFAWHGAGLPPIVAGSWCGWDPARGLRMERVGDGWEARLEIQDDAYAEYRLYHGDRVVTDPGNRDRVNNGVNGRNHRFWMPRATRRAEALMARNVPRGRVGRATLDLGWLAAPPTRRRVAFYLPDVAVRDAELRRSLPLLVVLDGIDYLRRGGLAEMLDALIADGSMAPVAALFIDHAGAGRPSEYAANDFTVASLADIVVPAAVEELGLERQRADFGLGRAAILGSSMGGLMALHAGTRRPDVFGRVIAQSTSAMLEELPLRDSSIPAVKLTTIALLEAAPPPPTRLWLDVGDLEDLAPSNDRLAAMLTRRGIDVTYRRFPGGHDHTSWGESLVDALPATFPARSASGG
jgi:enterochelin esterase-like enzyme